MSRSRQPRNSQSEHQLQRAVAAYLDRALPADAFWTSIDSAGRGAIQGARMKARGVKRGISDVLVLYQSATIWIELKSAKGRLTVEQKAFVLHACRAGHWPVVCRSIADLESELRSFGVPLRCKVSA